MHLQLLLFQQGGVMQQQANIRLAEFTWETVLKVHDELDKIGQIRPYNEFWMTSHIIRLHGMTSSWIVAANIKYLNQGSAAFSLRTFFLLLQLADYLYFPNPVQLAHSVKFPTDATQSYYSTYSIAYIHYTCIVAFVKVVLQN